MDIELKVGDFIKVVFVDNFHTGYEGIIYKITEFDNFSDTLNTYHTALIDNQRASWAQRTSLKKINSVSQKTLEDIKVSLKQRYIEGRLDNLTYIELLDKLNEQNITRVS